MELYLDFFFLYCGEMSYLTKSASSEFSNLQSNYK